MSTVKLFALAGTTALVTGAAVIAATVQFVLPALGY